MEAFEMIVVRVELWSAITGGKTELARMVIANEGTSENPRRGDYKAAYDARPRCCYPSGQYVVEGGAGFTHTGEVKNHARLQEHVWVLVTKALRACGYGRD